MYVYDCAIRDRQSFLDSLSSCGDDPHWKIPIDETRAEIASLTFTRAQLLKKVGVFG